MCIIVHKPRGAVFPAKGRLALYWLQNPDGAGFWVRRGSRYEAQKGFLNFKVFWSAIEAADIKRDEEAALHFRKKTAGRKNKGACHPFPLAQSPGRILKQDYSCRRIVMHNGTIKQYEGDRSFSDTQIFVMGVLYHARHVIYKRSIRERIAEIAGGSRLLISIDGETYRIGRWFKERGTGAWFSKKIVY